MKEKVRYSNFELMRIISMFLIVLWHCIMHTNLLSRTTGNLHLLLNLIYVFTAIHVNSFVLLCGYFQYDKEVKVKKFFSLVNSVWFYKASYAILFSILGIISIPLFDLFLFLTPINYSFSYGTFYWFINIYLVLYCFMPCINILIKNLSQSQHRRLLIISFFFLSVIPFFTQQQVVMNNGYQVISFIFLYLIGAYFGKYPIKKNLHFRNYSKYKTRLIMLALLFGILCIDFCLIAVSEFLKGNANELFIYIKSIIDSNAVSFSSPVLIIQSVIYLLLFESFNFKNKVVNKISTLMFGVYLAHENVFVFQYIYQFSPLGVEGSLSGICVLGNLLITSIVIFICSMLIEQLRQWLFTFVRKQKFSRKFSDWFSNIIKEF